MPMPLAEHPEFAAKEEIELHCYQNKLAKVFTINLAMQQQLQGTSETKMEISIYLAKLNPSTTRPPPPVPILMTVTAFFD